MKRTDISAKKTSRKAGFTLIEVMFASAIGLMVIGTIWSVYLTTIRTASTAQQYAWAQSETTHAGQSLASYIRNASGIDSIDESGNWVQIIMPSGTISRFEYQNEVGLDGMGQMLFYRDVSLDNEETIVARGLTKVMSSPVRNVFSQTGDNCLRIAFRVTKPLSPGKCPAEIDLGVRLRNN